MTVTSPRNFTKIKNTGKSVAIEWSTKRTTASKAEEHQSHQLECPERPRPAFDTALQTFLPFLLRILGAPVEWSDNTKVTGVSLNKEEDGRRGLVLTATRKCPFGAAPIALNTPHLRESQDATKEKGALFWLPGMDEAVDQMIHEAEKYLEGDRAQGELFSSEKTEASALERDNKKKRGKSEPEKAGDIAGRIGAGGRDD